MVNFLTGEAAGSGLLPFLNTPRGLLTCWLVVINVAAFLAFGIDKWKAKRSETNKRVRRIPERDLFLSAIFGGSIGALLGMKVWHHKTLHRSFRIGIPLILLLQIALAAGIFLWRRYAA
jgi:Predicted membrane protein